MGQFLQVNGDYNIKCADGATIKLDTGPGVGRVLVTGDLTVAGSTTTVETADLSITDNIITLNYGETGAGVTLDWAGIYVDRGTESYAALLFDEAADSWLLANGTAPSSLNYTNSNLRVRRIYTDPMTDGGDLILIGSGTGVVKVGDRAASGSDYEDLVTDEDDIPNKKYVDDAIQNNPTFQIVSDNSRVIVTDKDTVGSLSYISGLGYPSTTSESVVSFIVDGNLTARFFPNRTVLGTVGSGIEITGTTISTENSITNENITLLTQGTGKIVINYGLQIEKIATTPAYVSGGNILYAAEPSIGETGVWFMNDSSDAAKRNGELISKNKALVFSMLF